MALVINSTLDYLQTRLNIPVDRVQYYSGKTIDEILKAEAAQGNDEAVKLAADMFTQVSILIELFQLADPENRLVILQNMNEEQLKKLVPFLEVKDILEGLQFFNQDALLDLLKEIPIEELLKSVFELFTQEQVIEYMPEEELNKFLTDIKMDKDFLLKNLKNLPEVYLQQMLESVTGEPAQGDSADLATQIGQLGDLEYKTALTNLNFVQKQKLTLMLTSSDNKLYENFSTDAYIKMIAVHKEKPEIIASMEDIKPEYLQKMMEKLPQDLLSVVLTQIDVEKFADNLINKCPELLARFVAG